MALSPRFIRLLLRAPAFASLALCALAPASAQQRRPLSNPVDQFVFEGGVGFTAPAGGTSTQIDYGYHFLGGFGIKEGRYLATIAEFQYEHANLTGAELSSQQAPDGHRTVLSLTLNQKINLSGGPTHAYIIGGGGYYHQTTTLTEPGPPPICDPFTGFCTGGGDIILAQDSTDQLGANVGAGFEHRISHYSNAKLFAEARYTFLDTPGHSTQLVPVTLGIRF